MKAKLVSFAFIYFPESGLFKGLRAKKIKNFFSVLVRVLGCARPLKPPTDPVFFPSAGSARPRRAASLDLAGRNIDTTPSGF
jgi:hypothetical protein